MPRAYGRQLALTAPAERTSGNRTAAWLLDASAACVPLAPDVGRLMAANAAAARDASAMRWNVRFMGFPLLVSFSSISCLSDAGVAKPALVVTCILYPQVRKLRDVWWATSVGVTSSCLRSL